MVGLSIDRQDGLKDKHQPRTLVRYVSGFSWVMLATLATQASTYISLILLARILGLEAFGRLGTIQATLTAVFSASTLGIGITSTRFVARYGVTDPERAGRIVGLCSLTSLCSGSLFSIGLIIFADIIAGRLFHSPDLATSIRLTSPYCALMSANAHQIGALLGFEAFGRLLRAQALQGVTALLLTVSLVTSLGFTGAVLSLPLSAGFAWFYMHLELTAECKCRRVRPTVRNCWKESRILTSFTLPASLSGIITSAAIWSAQASLVRVNNGMQEIGLWTAAAAIRSIVMTGPAVLNRVALPILTSLHDHETGKAYSKAFWLTTALATGGAAAVGCLILLAGPLLLGTFGSSYRRAGSLLPLVIGSAILEVYASGVFQALFADTRLKYAALIISAWGSTLILVALIAVPHYRALGLAMSYCIAWVVSAIGYTLFACSVLNTRGDGKLKITRSPIPRSKEVSC